MEDVILDKGAILYHLGRYREAADCYERALAINPSFADARANRAAALRMMQGN